MGCLKIRLLGGLELAYGERSVAPPATQKCRQLLAFLALHRNRLHPRSVLAATLWPEKDEASARKGLRTTLWRLRSSLDPDRSAGSGVGRPREHILTRGDEVGLDPAAELWLDVAEFERRLSAAETGERGEEERRLLLREAVELYRGDLLEGHYEEWCLYERDRLQSRFLLALERLLQYELARGSWVEAIAVGQRLLRYDPLHEGVHRDLMRCYSSMDNRSGAMRQYERCVALLRRELGVGPVAETVRLAEAIRTDQGRPKLVPPVAAGEPVAPAEGLAPTASEVLSEVRRVELQVTEVRDSLEQAMARWAAASGASSEPPRRSRDAPETPETHNALTVPAVTPSSAASAPPEAAAAEVTANDRGRMKRPTGSEPGRLEETVAVAEGGLAGTSPKRVPGGSKPEPRILALRRFAFAISLFTLLGHTLFGFEQSPAQPLVSLAVAYAADLLLQLMDSRLRGERPPFAGGWTALFNALLPAHITGLAVAMLLYANDRLGPIAFASACAIASKYLFRVSVGGRARHFFNPSNFGIALTLLLFPWVGIAPPYMFTENLDGAGDWILPLLIVVSGSFLNARLTRRMPLIAGWLGGFAVQALLRSLVWGTPLVAALVPATGVAFVLFTFYMVTDPGTTPFAPRDQVLFGAAVAAAYGLLTSLHVVFGLFFGLSLVCALRGLGLYLRQLAGRLQAAAPAVGSLLERPGA